MKTGAARAKGRCPPSFERAIRSLPWWKQVPGQGPSRRGDGTGWRSSPVDTVRPPRHGAPFDAFRAHPRRSDEAQEDGHASRGSRGSV
eukprot:scaffold436_cov336-Pavlova_lutheri.AAC.6